MLPVPKMPLSPPPEENKEVTLYLPYFATMDGSFKSRGLTDLGIFKDDMLSGSSIMSYIPVMQALEKAVIKPSDIIETILTKYLNFTVYGFDCFIYEDSIRLENGFLYLRFYVKQNNQTVGVVDYALDIVNKKFSFREIMTLSLDYGFGFQDPNILIIEYDDIPIKPDGSFSTATFDESGELEKNVIVDFFSAVPDGPNVPNVPREYRLRRFYLTAKSENDIISTFVRTYDTEKYKINISNEADAKLKEILGDNLAFDNLEEAEKFQYELCEYVLPEIYENGNSLVSHDPILMKEESSNAYSNYEEYTSSSIRKIKNSEKVSESYNNGEDFITFNFKNPSSYATLRKNRSPEDRYQNYLTPNLTAEDIEGNGFKEFYPNIFDDSFTLEKFIEAHLRNSGIDDGNYIENFIAAWKKAYENVDLENPAEYPIWTEVVTNR